MTLLRVSAIRYEATGINSFELSRPDDSELAPFTAGAHIDVGLPNGMSRSYSLVNPQGERHRYVIAVNDDRNGRGGSRWLHERVRVGDLLPIGAPRNNFHLIEDAEESVLIAGGIGITPLWSMIQRLEQLGRRWTLHYCARTALHAAFRRPLDRLELANPGRVHFNFDQEPQGRLLDLATVISRVSPRAHIYCCGPPGMLAAFEETAASLPAERIHVEHFSAGPLATNAHGFTVVLARSGRSVEVSAGKTILLALQEEGINPPFSCMEGVCGTCEVRVLEGIPDHRDSVLSPSERADGRTMMICCSFAKSPRLVLDL